MLWGRWPLFRGAVFAGCALLMFGLIEQSDHREMAPQKILDAAALEIAAVLSLAEGLPAAWFRGVRNFLVPTRKGSVTVLSPNRR